MRALVLFRLRGAATPRAVLAPLVALLLVELLGLASSADPGHAGDATKVAVALVSAVSFTSPLLAWLARQVLDAEPDDQVRLSELAVGGAQRSALAGLLAAYAVVAPLALATTAIALVGSRSAGIRVGDAVLGVALALVTALAAVGIGAYAARSVTGTGPAAVFVLVGAPVLIAVLGLSRSVVLRLLVPRLDDAARAAYAQHFDRDGPLIVLQVLLWALVVLAVRLWLAGRGR